MSGFLMCRRDAPVVAAILGVALASCAGSDRPTGPQPIRSTEVTTMQAMDNNPNSAAGDAKGFINGWLDGETVSLRYTRLYFCAEPPSSAVSTHCEVGADATIAPRSGPIAARCVSTIRTRSICRDSACPTASLRRRTATSLLIARRAGTTRSTFA